MPMRTSRRSFGLSRRGLAGLFVAVWAVLAAPASAFAEGAGALGPGVRPGPSDAVLAGLVLLSEDDIRLRYYAVEECCTTFLECQDGMWCTGIEWCNCWGVCLPGVRPYCDDGNRCTNDWCVDDVIGTPGVPGTGGNPGTPGEYGTGHCEHRCSPAIAGCICPGACVIDADCDDGNPCTADRCDTSTGTGVCTSGPAPAGAVCRAAVAGGCDVAETCDGTSTTCPADGFAAGGTLCRASAGVCDVAETCSGTSNSCPTDLYAVGGAVCRPSAGPCDVDETCTGLAATCPADAFQSAGTICRPAAVGCDQAETCSGADAACPADQCRAYGTIGYCSPDAYACTLDACDGSCGCAYPVAPGWCLIGTTCVAEGTINALNVCQSCQSAVSQTAWTNLADGTVCTTDAFACTNQTCQAGVCTVTSTTTPANDLCDGSVLPMSGSGTTASWTGTGETFCALDNYSSSCGGGAGGRDTVHYFDVPIEYAVYRYRVQAAGPATFDPVVHLFGGASTIPVCGVAGSLLGCNNDGAADCWSYAGALSRDSNDSCWLSGAANFPSGRNYVVVDGGVTGGAYTVKVDRYGAQVDNTVCTAPAPQPEIQMGGTFYGTTNIATTGYYYGICTDSSSTPKYAATYHINHTVAPWRVTRGYVISTDGTLTPGGFDNVVMLLVNTCSVPQKIAGCDNDADHWSRSPPAGLGSRLVTGTIPVDYWASIDVLSWTSAPRGNYTLRVELDNDGDGVVNGVDASDALMQGARRDTGANEGAIPVAYWPYHDSRNSFIYPYDLIGRPGREVWYRRTPAVNQRLRVRADPWVQGGVLAGGVAALWDIMIYIYFPVAGTFCCDDGGVWSCSAAGAGSTRVCDRRWAGGYEDAYVETATAGQEYYVGIESYDSNPRGGWYTARMWTP